MRLIVPAFAALLLVAHPALAGWLDPPPDAGAYWTAPGFSNRPIEGPTKARGVVFWSHGVNNREIQYRSKLPTTIAYLANSHFDVIRVQRNPRWENSWINAGLKHVADLVARAEKAKADGYKLVIVAGQSYGGAISLEASARTAAIDGVLAMSPGYGSDVQGGGSLNLFENQTAWLVAAAKASKARRFVLVFGANDALHPYQLRGPALRPVLTTRGKPFILVDEALNLPGGHNVGYMSEFTNSYGKCIDHFLIARTVAHGKNTCPKAPIPPSR
jgi:pimeloyl-ACP methyl ester carboxylesterase